MDDKEAIEILKELVEKDSLAIKEKEALNTALGVLMLTVNASESYLRKIKAKHDKNSAE